MPETTATEVSPAVANSCAAAREWSRLPLPERIALLQKGKSLLEKKREELARGIALETGKPLREAQGELSAVLGKFDLTFQDAEEHLSEKKISGPHPSVVRRRARGPAAVVAPFNFPIHLGHGAALAHLVAGNPVLFKPSPLASVTCGEYGELLAQNLPEGVFQVVQGDGETGRELCLDQRVRSICFTGSFQAGQALARALADQIDKELALELGGKNPAIVFEDADLETAANAIADAMCFTSGQRCNSTSRLLVAQPMCARLLEELSLTLLRYLPGDPLSVQTSLGPLVSEASYQRYQKLLEDTACHWIVRGNTPASVNGMRGYYVTPSVITASDSTRFAEELFCPLLTVDTFRTEGEAIAKANASRYGLTASVFTSSAECFRRVSEELEFGNVYCNLATTFSPSTLPFGGFGLSGNRRPGGRGFVRFVTDEQVLQGLPE